MKIIAGIGLALFLSFPAAQEQDPEREKAARRLERFAAWAERESKICPWDWRAKALELGDPVRIFAFVRDEIAFEPYEGAMRGSAGVLLARGGNAFEKAQLLRDMLGAAGFEARLVSGTLPADRCDRLLRAFVERDPLRREPAGDDRRLARAVQDFGLSEEDVLRFQGRMRSDSEIDDVELAESVDREFAFLRARLAEAGVPLAADPTVARLRDVVARHFWVRRRDPATDRWIDLDPTFVDGVAYGERPTEIAAPDPKLVHRVEFRLLITQSAEGKEKETEVLAVSLAAPDSATEPIRFAILPSDPRMPEPAQLAKRTAPEVQRHLAACGRFQALLSRGGRRWFSLAWDRQGRTYKPVGGKLQEMIRDFGMDLEDPMGEKPKPKLTKVRIELRLTGPAGSRVQERVLLDDAPLRKNDLLTTWDLAIVAHPLPPSFADYLAARTASTVASALAQSVRGRPAWQGTSPALSSPALSFLLARQEKWNARLARMEPDSRPAALWSEIGLVISKQNVRLRKEGAEAWKCTALDIVATSPRYVDRSAELKVASPSNLLAGVLDSCLEELSALPCARSGRREGTVAYFAVRRIEGRGATTVARRSELDLAAMPAYTRRWIAESEPGSCVGVFPDGWKETEEFHWWCVDASTGACLGRNWDGEGGSDWTWLQYEATAQQQSLFTFISWVFCFATLPPNLGNAELVYLACCLSLNYYLYHKFSNLWINLLLLMWSELSTFYPKLDPCGRLVEVFFP